MPTSSHARIILPYGNPRLRADLGASARAARVQGEVRVQGAAQAPDALQGAALVPGDLRAAVAHAVAGQTDELLLAAPGAVPASEDGPAVAPDAAQVPEVADAVPAAVQHEGLVLELADVPERRRGVAPGQPVPAVEPVDAARRLAAVGGPWESLGALPPA